MSKLIFQMTRPERQLTLRLQNREIDSINTVLSSLIESLNVIIPKGPQVFIQEILNDLEHSNIPIVHDNIQKLRKIIEKELHGILLMFIPQSDIIWFNNINNIGYQFIDVFPSTKYDVIESGNCYAKGRYTACVFHLMRVLEHGLRALAKDVGLSFDVQQWYGIINQIEKEIKKLQDIPKSKNKSERLRFMSEAAKEFTYFKDGWRNYVSHGQSIYDGQQALSALNYVQAFMSLLATRLSG